MLGNLWGGQPAASLVEGAHSGDPGQLGDLGTDLALRIPAVRRHHTAPPPFPARQQ
ncbi:hypothetical protein [Streptomyces sp. NPDC088400]|uniref:hypothetical protein n=1 Tax=Streptomyces sp. NPDC088400 TaxID=3365861 RepID=UPI0038013306